MLNLNSTIDLEFNKFIRWWTGELAFLVPEKIKQLVHESQGYLIVTPKDRYLELSYSLNGHSEALATLDRNEAGIAQYAALRATDERLDKAQLVLRLTRQDAVQIEVSLPVAAKENLQQVVAYELDRYTPFKPEQVYFAVKPLETSRESGQITAMVVLTPREVLDALYEDIKAQGMSPLFADYEGAPNALEGSYDYYDLLPEQYKKKTGKTQQLIHAGLIGGLVLLLAAVLVLPIWFEYQAVNLLNRRITGIEKDARSIEAMQVEIDAMVDETRRLLNEKKAAPSVVAMLNTLSAIIKDDTWLTYAQYSGGHLQIQGQSPAASSLIGMIEASKLFSHVGFGSPVTQDKRSGLERFQITADVTKAGDSGGAN
ncbi:MAG: PilN domain-containing protein [Gammaproteobacteria bacterium]